MLLFTAMDWIEIVQLLEQGEGQSLEFEREITSAEDIARELVAFSNCDGGKLVFGLDDKNKHLLGVQIDSGFNAWVQDVVREHCSPIIFPQIEIIDKDGKHIVIISVPEGDEKPYRADDLCYVRDESISRPAKAGEEDEIKTPWSGKDLNKRQKRAVQYLVEHRRITNRLYRELFNISHKTAHLELTMLADKGLVESQGSGRSTCYVLLPEHLAPGN